MKSGGFYLKSGGFHVKSTQNLINSDVSAKTLQFGWISDGFHGIWWISYGFHEIWQISWNPLDFIRISWNPADFIRISCEIERPLARNCNPMFVYILEWEAEGNPRCIKLFSQAVWLTGGDSLLDGIISGPIVFIKDGILEDREQIGSLWRNSGVSSYHRVLVFWTITHPYLGFQMNFGLWLLFYKTFTVFELQRMGKQ